MAFIILSMVIIILSPIFLPLIKKMNSLFGPVATTFACGATLVMPLAVRDMLHYTAEAMNNIGNMENWSTNTSKTSILVYAILTISFLVSATWWRKTNKPLQLIKGTQFNEIETDFVRFQDKKLKRCKKKKKNKKSKK